MVGCGGGIAAYKICSLVSSWAKAQAPVRVILTAAGAKFITPLTLATLARHPVYTDHDLWEPTGRPLHIELGEWSGVLVIAPLSAHTLGKLALGLADDLLTNMVLASRCPVLIAPAMNTAMWEQTSVQRNLALLLTDPRYHLIPPTSGRLACDTVGTGRMAEPEEILTYTQGLFWTGGGRDLVGKRVLISGGGTREPWDPVRFLGNPATGQMALALARSAFQRGATVTLVHGPLKDPVPEYITAYPVITAQHMGDQLERLFPETDILIMNAAVGDVRPKEVFSHKVPKSALPHELTLEPIPDLVQGLVQKRRPGQCIVGFAAQTGDILGPAWEKLRSKKVDALFVNPVDLPDSGFGQALNQGWILLANGEAHPVDPQPKLAVAHLLWDTLKKTFFDP